MNYKQLIKKYNVPAPRYTSYPTVPFWEDNNPDHEKWMATVARTFKESNEEKGISIYIHLPYCESLCTYCGCNKRITKNHSVEGSYIQSLLKEWQFYTDTFERKPNLREIHLGGGTPTFFSPSNLQNLIKGIQQSSTIHKDHEFGFEGHPNNTKPEHLQALYDLGFQRVSFGVQDFDEKIQRTINRIQPYKKVADITTEARRTGYQSINFDLVYGLPFQSLEIISNTIDLVGNLMPERIAFYSYAHVPWKMPSQRGYTEADLPDNDEKRALYELGKRKLLDLGYEDVGMDHFALPGDDLLKAKHEKRLHRNFMGYTTSQSDLLIGLGTSSISDAKYAFAQNLKVVETYKEAISNGELAIFRGHFLNEEDLQLKFFIRELICNGEAVITSFIRETLNEEIHQRLIEMEDEGLLTLTNDVLKVTETGFAFIRNIAMLFDAHLKRKKAGEKLFSKSI